MIGITKLVEWIWNKAEHETSNRLLSHCEHYYGPAPVRPLPSSPETIKQAYGRDLAIWSAGQRMLDDLAEFITATTPVAKEKKPWNINRKLTGLQTGLKRTVESIRSGETK